jgi:hypothetical protein
MDYLTADLPSLIAAANNIAAETKSTFGRMTPAQLNWKPSPERWSVAQCFDHLLTSNKGYFPTIDGVLTGIKPTFWQRMPVIPGLAAKLLIKSLDPKSTRKIKAPQKFQPAQSDISPSVIDDFVDQQARMIEKMKSTEHLNLDKIIITSPVAAAVTYSLMDAYRIIVVHTQRHFEQARRVTAETAFPV